MYFYGWSSHFGHISLTSGKNPIESPRVLNQLYLLGSLLCLLLVCTTFSSIIQTCFKMVQRCHQTLGKDNNHWPYRSYWLGVLKSCFVEDWYWAHTHTLNKITNAEQVYRTQFYFH